MDRRDLLKAIAPVGAALMTPFIVKGKEVGKKIEIDPKAKYFVFVNSQMIDARAIAEDPHCPLPEGTPIYSVYAGRDVPVQDAICIYELKG